MPRLAALFVFLLICPAVFAQDYYQDMPGSDDETKIANIQRAVAQVRHFAASQACFAEHFPVPGDEIAIIHWSSWICSYVGGGPAGENENCSWYYQYGSNGTLTTERDELAFELIFKHNIPIGTEMMTIFTELLVKALIGTGTHPPELEENLIELFEQLTLVKSENADIPCAEPDIVIPWKLPGNEQTQSVALGGLVAWEWGDDNEHAIDPNEGEPVLLAGFGSNQQSFSRTTACTTGSAAYPDGGTPCNLAGTGEFSYAHYFESDDTIEYHCPVHADLTGTLTVGAGATGTGTNTVTSPADVDDVDGDNDGNNDGGDGGAAMRLNSWL